LSRANYDRVGGLRGLIEDAAERALRGLAPEEDAALPAGPPTRARIDLAASTFVPALAQINDQGATIRRIAAWSSFSEEQQDLLIRFDQWRLVVRKGEAGTVEVAHEALFREWSRLMGWLEPERARLEALRSLQTDALTWDRAGRDAAFLNHRGRRLAETAALAGIEAYRRRMGAAEFEYLKHCQAVERRARSRARGVQALIYALLVGVIVGLVGWINQGTLKAEATWFFTERPYIRDSVRPYVLTAEAERALKPLASFRECAENCPEMIVVPPGEFVMGSPATEPGRQADEGPQHKVTIARPFAVSRYDVTFADWDACVAVGECPAAPNGGWGEGARPVINVSLGDAQKYVAWLSQITGEPYRLLSEAEWEYAARAGRPTAYFWGDDIGQANADCIGCGSPWDGKESSPVGSFKPNAFGLYDMAGDVWQFVQDCPHANYDGAPADGSVWPGGDCSRHSVRGGSSNSPPQDIRSARRYKISTDTRDTGLGFRVARTLLAP
jgi:formylglycine-generating enzyme required for sulfatase activity